VYVRIVIKGIDTMNKRVIFPLFELPDASCFFMTPICRKVDPDQGFEDGAARPGFEFEDLVGGNEGFREAGSEYHLGRCGPDARGRWGSLVRHFELSGHLYGNVILGEVV